GHRPADREAPPPGGHRGRPAGAGRLHRQRDREGGEVEMTTSTWDRPPAMEIDPARSYSATIETSRGTITAELFAAEAPSTVNNFVFLGRQGFFDGLTFHRVIPGFVIQGGDPKGTGEGDAGYAFRDELDND